MCQNWSNSQKGSKSPKIVFITLVPGRRHRQQRPAQHLPLVLVGARRAVHAAGAPAQPLRTPARAQPPMAPVKKGSYVISHLSSKFCRLQAAPVDN
jgi:hypothetical protein